MEAGGGSSSTTLNITGNIWIDEPQGKGSIYNDLYDSATEKLYTGQVKVSLINPNGTVVSGPVTTSNGTYSFNTGLAAGSNLTGYYLKLEYDKNYSLVSPNFENKNGSKALIMDANKGEAYIYNLSDYINNNELYTYPTLSYMNLGLVTKAEESFQVNQEIEHIKLVINGYTYTYKYGSTGNNSSTAAPKINWETQSGFTRAIYPSDIAYSMQNNWDDNSLKVYVVYKITIKNNTLLNYGKSKSSVNTPISYVEVGLQIESLYNNYDSNRYELETKYDSSKYKDFANWSNESTGKAKYDISKLNNIAPNKPAAVYIEFKVKKEALVKLLQDKETYENTPTTATATGFHNYWKSEYVWVTNWKKELRIFDMKTSSTSQNKSANYLKLKISTERTITGTVFEDNNTKTNGEVIGNGKIDDSENKIKNVKVDLLMADDNGKITNNSAKLYRISEGYAEKTVRDLNIVTDENGTYSIKGITPGKYFVKFTYGDGTEKYTIANYKSTVVTDPYAAKALGDNGSLAKSSDEWYKYLADTKCSVVVDDLDQRAEYNKDKTERNSIDAKTALLSISVENTQGNYATITTVQQQEGGVEEIISGINLGLIRIPQISLLADKVVSNIQITNAQGNIIVNGNPASQNLKGANNLDTNKSHLYNGSNYIKAEIEEQELYGSTVKLTYSITVRNNSEVNYYEKDIDKNNASKYGYYYKFGKTGSAYNSKQVTITINEIEDYLDKTLTYVDNSVTSGFTISKNDTEIDAPVDDTYKAKTLIITANKEIEATGGNKYKSGNTNVDATVQFIATRLLSANDKDMSSTNIAKITKLEVTNKPALVETIDSSKIYFNDETYTNPTKEAYVAITLPTGGDRLSIIIYSIAGVVLLAIMVAGIIVIKKRVINK